MRSRMLATGIAAAIAGGFALFALTAVSGNGETVNEIVSVSTAGAPGDSISSSPSISADGRYVAFSSDATTFVEPDTNGRDVFLHDRQTGVTTLVSVATDGTQADRAALNPAVSGDGRYVVFDSEAGNLAANDDPEASDVFIRDLVAGTTALLSIASDGTPGNGDSSLPAISADGRYVTFTSSADNLVPDDANQERDVFIRDLVAGTTELVSVSTDGVQGNLTSGHIQAGQSRISADGRYVVFGSFADNLVPDDRNQADDAFIRDRMLGTTERASVTDDVIEGNGHSMHPDVSDDGRYVVFDSFSTNLYPADGLSQDIVVRDREAGMTFRVNVTSDGAAPDDASYWPAISGDGAWVAFTSEASNLVEGDLNGRADIFLFDMGSGDLQRASVSDGGAEGEFDSTFPDLSVTGVLAYQSHATNLVPGDENGVTDVFVRGKHLRASTPVPTATSPDMPTVTPTPSPIADTGDVDCGGTVNSIDAALVLQYVAGLLGKLACRVAADVNESGAIDAIDAALILQFVAGFFESLPP